MPNFLYDLLHAPVLPSPKQYLILIQHGSGQAEPLIEHLSEYQARRMLTQIAAAFRVRVHKLSSLYPVCEVIGADPDDLFPVKFIIEKAR